MNRKGFRKGSLQIKIEKNFRNPSGKKTPQSSLLINSTDLFSITNQKINAQRSPLTLNDSPGINPKFTAGSNSVLSLKSLENCPLTEVTSLVPTEILPSECPHSENPSVNYFFDRAFESSQKQEYQTAIKMYKKVIACEPNHFESWINIGICLMKQNMHSEAISSFENAIKANKSSFVPYLNKALSFIQVRDFDAALQCMDSAITNFPEPPPELQKIRTFAIFKSGKVSSAISNTEAKESPTPQKLKTRAYSPIQVHSERQNFEPRRMTMPASTSQESKNIYFNKNFINFKKVEEIDTRSIKTAFSVPIRQKYENNSQSMSPIRTAKTKKKNQNVGYNWKKFQPQEFFQPKQNLTLPIFQMEAKSNSTNDPVLIKKIREKLASIHEKLLSHTLKKMKKGFSEPEWVNKVHYTEKEVKRIMELFQNDAGNFEEIDEFLKNSEFFSNFSCETREQIYRISCVVCVEKDSIVFLQGTLAENYYCLLKGKCASVVDTEKAEPNSTTEYLRFSRSLSNDNKLIVTEEYRANCTATETSYFLLIPSKHYQILLTDILKSEIEEKICFLINLPLFKGLDPLLLIPLAWHIKKEKFKENQSIVNKGEIPKGLVIIYSGYCAIYTTGYIVRSRLGSEFANIKIRKPRPPSMYTGNLKKNSMKIEKKWNTRKEYVTENYSSSSNEIGDDLNSSSEFYRTCERIEHGVMQHGDHFGGRLLMDQKVVEMASKFAVVAESKIVETLLITKANLQLVPEKVATHLKTVLQKTQDLDCPQDINSSKIDKEFSKWQKYKHEIIDNVRRNNFVNAKKIEFPYLR